MNTPMKASLLLLSLLVVLGTGCFTSQINTPTDWKTIAQQDITGDTTAELFIIQPSAITLDSSLASSYQYAITAFTVTSTDSHALLTIDQEGITSEDGTKVKAAITTQVAYALGLGNGYLFYIVQIDSAGKAVSEPITFTWDQAGSKWVMGK